MASVYTRSPFTNLIPGQRYDIIFEADQAAANYWMRALPALGCSSNQNQNGIQAIVTYEGQDPNVLPTSTPWVPADTNCEDETGLVPVVPRNVGTFGQSGELDVSILPTADNIVTWNINSSSFLIDYASPTLLLVEDHDDSFPGTYNVVQLNGDDTTVSSMSCQSNGPSGYISLFNQWVNSLLIIPYLTSTLLANELIHLHGHDFALLASGPGNFTPDVLQSASLVNPTRRDVVTMPASAFGGPTGGFIVIAFALNNPGNWVFPSHIGRGLMIYS